MRLSFFHFQHTLNRLFNNCMKLYIAIRKVLLETRNGEGGQIDPWQKNYPSLITVKVILACC